MFDVRRSAEAGRTTLPTPSTLLALSVMIWNVLGLSDARGVAAADRPQPVVRPSDTRPRHNDKKLAARGIRRFASRRLVLYTDIEPAKAEVLPPLADRIYDAWEAYFGKLPPDRERTDFQITGYLMADQEPFRAAGLIPAELPPFTNGRHRGQEFWMNDQPSDYYRAHLVLHEATHCFMSLNQNSLMTFAWYMEGMAELFATHSIDEKGHIRFRVMPFDNAHFVGLSRIHLIEDERSKTGPRTLDDVLSMKPDDTNTQLYAWSWALCRFLDGHPRYRERFRQMAKVVADRALDRDYFERQFRSDLDDLREEWLLFANALCVGYDIERAAIEFRAGRPLRGTSPQKVEIAADRGWQSSGVALEAGKKYRIAASGRVTLAQLPKPWESEPQGVSIRYHDGLPLGMLVGSIRAARPPADPPHSTMLEVLPLGRGATIIPKVPGTLYLRINDNWSELADNMGKVTVEIQADGAE